MRLTAITAGVIFVLDQVTKYIVVHAMGLAQVRSIDFLPPWINFRMAWNEGINFGLFANSTEIMRWVLIALALGISLWVWLWIRKEPHRPIVHLSAGILIGGALGNVIDRVIYGAVADFLNMSLPFWDNPYSFNVADIAIFAGAAGLFLFTGEKKTT